MIHIKRSATDVVIHIKRSATDAATLCGEKDDCAWSSDNLEFSLADCSECVHEVLVCKCGACGGRGFIKDYDEEWPCRSCDGEAWLERRAKPKATEEN